MTHRFISRPVRLAVPALAAGAVIAAAAGLPAQASPTPGWRVIRTLPAHNTSLDTIAVPKGGPAWAGGESSAQLPVVYHLVGGTWHAVTLPGTIGTFVNSMSATSGTNVWASLANTPAVEHLTAKGWVGRTFAIGSDQILMAGVVSLSPKDTFVFADDIATRLAYVYHDNGKLWTRKLIPSSPDGNSETGLISATSYRNVWALTDINDTPGSMRFNGKTWQLIKFPGHLAPAGTEVLGRQIFAQSPTNVWATVYTAAAKNVGPVVLMHWNGRKWSKVGGRLPKAALIGPIASDGSGGLWLAGENTEFTKPLLLHYSHGKWSTHSVPTVSGKLLSISEMSLIPGTHSILGAAVIAPTFGATLGSAVIKDGR